MACDDETPDSGTPTDGGCLPADQLLAKIKEEIDAYEAKKLGDLKKDLETFIGTQADKVKDYENKYKELRKRWCDQEQKIEQLYRAITHSFPPDPGWKALIKQCICGPLRDVDCLEIQVRARKERCLCPDECRKTRAQTAFDAAKAQLELLVNLTKALQDRLDANGKLIDRINSLMSGPDHAVVLYLFFFKLLPVHRCIAPDELPTGCTIPGGDDTPEKLCPPKDCGCKSPCDDNDPPKIPDCDLGCVPRLVKPDTYRRYLDRAWCCLRARRDQLADAEREVKKEQDITAAKAAKLAEDKKTLDERIEKCLKDKNPKDPCCPDSDPCADGDRRSGA